MRNLQLAQVCFLLPVFNGLEQAGVNLKKIKKASCLDRFSIDNPENYIPVSVAYSFFNSVARIEGIDQPHSVFSREIHLTSLASWGESVACAPDVLSAFNFAIQHQGIVLTNETLTLTVDGPRATFAQRFTDIDAVGKAQLDFVNLLVILDGMRLALGPSWDPLEINFQSKSEPDMDKILQPQSATVVRCGQEETSVVFPTELLCVPMPVSENTCSTLETPESFQLKVEVLLDSMLQAPHLSAFSEISNISSRTIQRRLSEEGTSFSRVLERWRFKKAVTLLNSERLMVKEISERLHYTEASNFERAFRRWTNTTAGKYLESKNGVK